MGFTGDAHQPAHRADRRAGVLEREPQRPQQVLRMRRFVRLGWPQRVAQAPPRELLQHRDELLPGGREPVPDLAPPRLAVGDDDPLVLQHPQPLGQRLGGDAAQRVRRPNTRSPRFPLLTCRRGWCPPTTPDATAHRLAGEGTALRWRGDYPHARRPLTALGRRLDRHQPRPADDPAEAFHRHRRARRHRARVLSHLLVALDADYGFDLRRARTSAKRAGRLSAPLRGLGAAPERTARGPRRPPMARLRGIPVAALGERIYPPLRRLLADQERVSRPRRPDAVTRAGGHRVRHRHQGARRRAGPARGGSSPPTAIRARSTARATTPPGSASPT